MNRLSAISLVSKVWRPARALLMCAAPAPCGQSHRLRFSRTFATNRRVRQSRRSRSPCRAASRTAIQSESILHTPLSTSRGNTLRAILQTARSRPAPNGWRCIQYGKSNAPSPPALAACRPSAKALAAAASTLAWQDGRAAAHRVLASQRSFPASNGRAHAIAHAPPAPGCAGWHRTKFVGQRFVIPSLQL